MLFQLSSIIVSNLQSSSIMKQIRFSYKTALQKAIVSLFNSLQFIIDSIKFNYSVKFAKFFNHESVDVKSLFSSERVIIQLGLCLVQCCSN